MQSDGGWKAAAKSNWLAIGLPEFLASIGVDFDKYFIEAVNRSPLNTTLMTMPLGKSGHTLKYLVEFYIVTQKRSKQTALIGRNGS